MNKSITAIAVIVFIVVWLGLTAVIYIAFKSINEVGIRAVVERVWCGKDGCK